MFDFSRGDGKLRRPALLMRAAAAGVCCYNRSRDLRRLLGGSLPGPAEAVARLEEAEARAEMRRSLDSAAYSVTAHVALLTALLAEQKLAAACETRQPAGPAGESSGPGL